MDNDIFFYEEQTKSARGAMEKEEFPPSLAK